MSWYYDCGGFVSWVALFGYSFVNSVGHGVLCCRVLLLGVVVVCLCVVSVVCDCSCLLGLFGLLVLVLC